MKGKNMSSLPLFIQMTSISERFQFTFTDTWDTYIDDEHRVKDAQGRAHAHLNQTDRSAGPARL